jgi:hypothetical protein
MTEESGNPKEVWEISVRVEPVMGPWPPTSTPEHYACAISAEVEAHMVRAKFLVSLSGLEDTLSRRYSY